MNVSKEDVAMLGRRRAAPSVPAGKRVATTRKEQDIQRAILDAAKFWRGVRLWKTGGGLLPLADGRRVRMGVVGVSDLIGWAEMPYREHVCAHPEHREARYSVGEIGGVEIHYHWGRVARLIAIEVKKPGKFPTQEQQAFLDAVTAAGGIGICARSVEDVRRVVQP